MPNRRGQFEPRFGLFELTAAGTGSVPEWIQVLPDGWVKTVKGTFLADAQARREIMQLHQQRGLDVVYDYEHQTLSGSEAPAAGWIKELADRGDQGLWARIEWTEKAKGYLERREYRYQSPVVLVRKSDSRAVYLQSGALTNTPAIDGLQPLVASATFTQMFENFMGAPQKEDREMDLLEKLRGLLKLPADATEAQVLEALQSLLTRVQNGEVALSANKQILLALDLAESATADQARGKILSLKNPSGYVPIADHLALKTELDQLKTKQTEKDAGDLVELALTQGKIAPAQKDWATAYALKDPAGFKSFVDQAPEVVPIGQRVAGKEPPKKKATGEDDEVQLHVNSLLGVTAEDIAKHGGGK